MTVVTSLHAVRITVDSLSPARITNSGSTVYYADTESVSASNNQGSLADGGAAYFEQPTYFISAGSSNLTVVLADQSIQAEDWHYVGDDGEPAFENDWHHPNQTYELVLTGQTAGQFKLAVNGGTPTANIAFDADAATITTALEATAEVGVGDVVVTEVSPPDPGVAGGQIDFMFTGALATQAVTLTVSDGTTPLDPGSPTLNTGTTSAKKTLRFYKQAERVYIDGAAIHGSTVSGTNSTDPAFTLPVGYRPDLNVAPGTSVDITVSTAGVVAPRNSRATINLAGFSFRVA